jgi:hypothetical protein
MADTDRVSEGDRLELAGLERVVSEAERMLLSLPPGTRPFFNGFLHNAKARLGILDKKIHDAERGQQEQARNEVAFVSLAQKEAALNAREKETYSGFLKEEFFTKRDFARLEEFYAHSWDRLSEGGKDQMSQRVWEGVRRGEYKFAELPKPVREKETERAYKVLHNSSIELKSAVQVPEKDRQDFLRAYESGNRPEASKILERESFRKSMFLGRDAKSVEHAGVDTGREAEGQTVGKEIAAGIVDGATSTPSGNGGNRGNLDVSDLNLDGVKLVEVSTPPAVADMPKTGGAPVRSGASLRGG